MLHLYALLDSQGTVLLVTLRQPPFQISTAWLVWSSTLREHYAMREQRVLFMSALHAYLQWTFWKQ